MIDFELPIELADLRGRVEDFIAGTTAEMVPQQTAFAYLGDALSRQGEDRVLAADQAR